ncbi:MULTISPECIES: hypothetical protein [unclassified Herbaspirillum]|uniref:hypothetical protein n=1 Tax=unclassified Herbaspirillum TaxID=2624150 RepID=UPI00383B0774
MFSRLFSFAILMVVALLSGCATPVDMAFSKDQTTPVAADKTVFLMTATIKNTYFTSHQPKMLATMIEKSGATSAADRLNFRPDKLSKIESDTVDGSTYLIRMELDKGEYVVRGFSCMSSRFPIHGFYFAPIHAKLISSAPGVYYLGHVDASVRARKDNEFRAGPVIPLIDQAVAGASGGTFEVAISDQWAKDESQFKSKFPALQSADIQMAILPEFDRKGAQQWWEDH